MTGKISGMKFQVYEEKDNVAKRETMKQMVAIKRPPLADVQNIALLSAENMTKEDLSKGQTDGKHRYNLRLTKARLESRTSQIALIDKNSSNERFSRDFIPSSKSRGTIDRIAVPCKLGTSFKPIGSATTETLKAATQAVTAAAKALTVATKAVTGAAKALVAATEAHDMANDSDHEQEDYSLPHKNPTQFQAIRDCDAEAPTEKASTATVAGQRRKGDSMMHEMASEFIDELYTYHVMVKKLQCIRKHHLKGREY